MKHPGTREIEELKKLVTKCMMVFILFVMPSFASAGDTQTQAQQLGELKVIILGLKSDEGKAKIALFDSKERYSGGGEPLRGFSIAIRGGTAECTFEGIPYGTYAIKVYHDKNGNDKLDTNFMGIPKEPYGFSNDARGAFGPVKWDAAKFAFNSKSMSKEQ